MGHLAPGFDPVGARMLWHWNEGLKLLNQRISMPVPDIKTLTTEADVAEPMPPQKFAASRHGESPLLVTQCLAMLAWVTCCPGRRCIGEKKLA